MKILFYGAVAASLLSFGCKTMNSGSDTSARDSVGEVAWNSKIISELPMGSVLTLNKDVNRTKDIFDLNECTVYAPTYNGSRLAKGTKFTLIGQVAGYYVYDKNGQATKMTGNWLVAKMNGQPNSQVGIGCYNTADRRFASSMADVGTLKTGFKVDAAPGKIEVKNNYSCAGSWVDSFLSIKLGTPATIKAAAVVEKQGVDPGELRVSGAAGVFCTMKPSGGSKFVNYPVSYQAGSRFSVVGQQHNFILNKNTTLCGTGLVVENDQRARYLLSCVETSSSKNLTMPQQDLQMESIRKVLDL